MLLRAGDREFETDDLRGWRLCVVSWLTRWAVRLSKPVARSRPVPEAAKPRILEQFQLGERAYDRPNEPPKVLDRYEQQVDQPQVPLLAFTDPRAFRYAYNARRKFATPSGDFDHVPRGAVDDEPIAIKSNRRR